MKITRFKGILNKDSAKPNIFEGGFYSDVQTSRGSLFHHISAKAEQSVCACLSCALRDDGSSKAVLEEQREHGAVCSMIRGLGWKGAGSLLIHPEAYNKNGSKNVVL